ncbi:hypothetical protein [Metallumcola ferriviriculae]
MLTPKDIKVNTDYEVYPVIVIEDGNLIGENLKSKHTHI